MSDEQNSGIGVPTSAPVANGASEWWTESHRQSAPMAPLTEGVPSSPPLRVDPPRPAAVVAPTQPTAAAQPVGAFSFATTPLSPSPSGSGPGPTVLALERRGGRSRSGNGLLDWVAFVLAFLAPPIGLLLGVIAAVLALRSRGFAASIAKAAIGIGAGLSLVLAAGIVVETRIANQQAAHAAIVASSAAWCAKFTSDPTALSSDTYGWPAPGETIASSLTAIKAYQARWESLAKIAPSGIRTDSQTFADRARTIASSVETTQTLNDAANVSEMQNLVQATGIRSWISNYCS